MAENPLIKLVPDSIDNAVKNITDSPTNAIGETVSELWFLVLGGKIHQVAEKRKLKYAQELEQFHNELRNGINSIPPEKQIEPKMQVVAPAIQNLQYCVEEKELRELFKNLILASLNKDTSEQVHPSFSDTIKRMSPRDASNLASFGNVANVTIAEYRLKIGSSNFTPIVPYVFLHNKKYSDIHNQSASISMLETLGLVKVDFSAQLNESSYTEFYQTEEYKIHKEMAEIFNESSKNPPSGIPPELKHTLQQQHSIEVRKGMIILTPIGSMLKQLCGEDT